MEARVPESDALRGPFIGIAMRTGSPPLRPRAGRERAERHAGPEVEVVDVTDALVKLFEPSAKTLATVAEVRKQAPVDLDELEHD